MINFPPSFTSMHTSAIQSELNQELRDFANQVGTFQSRPTMDEAIAAIKPYFPQLIDQFNSVQALLDEVGLPVITDISRTYKPKRISWSIAATEVDANNQLELYSQVAYAAIRENLAIDYHWIFWVPDRDLYSYKDDVLIEGSIDFAIAERPKCWILDQFR